MHLEIVGAPPPAAPKGARMTATYKQANMKANVSLEKGTENVPRDGQFHLLVDGKVVASFKTLRQGKAAYEKELAARNISTSVAEVTMTEAQRKQMLRDMVSSSYQAESSASIKIPKKSGARRYG
jgi:hypothetical protein